MLAIHSAAQARSAGIVDARQRLQGDGLARLVRERAAEIMPVAAHGERGRPDRPAEVEGEDLRARDSAGTAAPSAPAARSCRRRSDRPPAYGRRRRHGGRSGTGSSLPSGQRTAAAPSRCSSRSGPAQTAENGHHVGEVEGRDRRLADVGVDMARAALPSQASTALTRLAHAGEVAALDDLLDQAQPLVRDARIVVPDRDRGGDIGLRRRDRSRAPAAPASASSALLAASVSSSDRRLVGHHLLEDRHDRLALGEPLPADAGSAAWSRRSCRGRSPASTSDRGRRAD